MRKPGAQTKCLCALSLSLCACLVFLGLQISQITICTWSFGVTFKEKLSFKSCIISRWQKLKWAQTFFVKFWLIRPVLHIKYSRAGKVVLSSLVCKNYEVYTPETSRMKGTTVHIKNMWIKQLCNSKVRDFAIMAFRARKVPGAFEKRTLGSYHPLSVICRINRTMTFQYSKLIYS